MVRSVRKLVTAVEDLVDDVVERAEGAERDLRTLVNNLVKEREEEDEARSNARAKV